MDGETTEDEARDAGVLSGLPRSRPQRRSERRTTAPGESAAQPKASRTASAKPRAKAPARAKAKTAKPKAAPAAGQARIRQPAQPRNVPPPPSPEAAERRPAHGPEGVVLAAVQAAEEVTRLGVAVGGQLVKSALRRIPRP